MIINNNWINRLIAIDSTTEHNQHIFKFYIMEYDVMWCDMWHVICDIWCDIQCDIWHDMWCDMWGDMWGYKWWFDVIHNMWYVMSCHVMHDMWCDVIHDMWCDVRYGMVWYGNVQKYLSLQSLIWRASQLVNLSDNIAFIV